jgi:hypothetical protein
MALLFCGAFLGDAPPRRATLRCMGAGTIKQSTLAEGDWCSFLSDEMSTIHYARRELAGLDPGVSYEVELAAADGEVLASASFDTLPNRLPRHANGSGPNRPLSIWLSSCFYSPKAPSGLEEMVQSVVTDARIRPHLKIFPGDQVYVDYPQTKVLLLTRESLRQHFNEVYTSSWTQPAFSSLLSTGASYFLVDDHELWDNYPDNPSPILWGVRGSGFWEAWKKLALERCEALQGLGSSQQLDVGPKDAPELSIFLAQTRLERSRGPYRILSEESMAALETWLATLRCPGMLVVTQPVISHAGGSDDWNLPDYRQFRERLRPALENAPCDVVVLAGDPHFGRIAVVEFENHRMVEVVASPLTLVSPQAGAAKAATPATFPSYGPMTSRAAVSYPRVVPSYQAGGYTLSEEHGMLLTLYRSSDTELHLHVALKLARQDTPADEWHWETTLRFPQAKGAGLRESADKRHVPR